MTLSGVRNLLILVSNLIDFVGQTPAVRFWPELPFEQSQRNSRDFANALDHILAQSC